jgi:hypothetical protein
MDLYHGKEIKEKSEDKKGGYGCLSRAWFFHWNPCQDGRGIEERWKLSGFRICTDVQESFSFDFIS